MTRTTVLLVISLIIAGCNRAPFDYDLYENSPIVQVEVKFRVESEHGLESVLHAFATENGYKMRVARVNPTEPRFSVMMWRSDSMIMATNPFGPYVFGVYPAKERAISPESAKLLESQLMNIGGEVMPNQSLKSGTPQSGAP